MVTVKQFVFGKEKAPDWFGVETSAGRAKVNYDEDGNVINAIVYTPTKKLVANIGDTIMLYKSGLAVLNSEQAKKYKVQRSVKEVSENE